jgi:hypothetical protein
MFAQYFGQFLLNRSFVTAAELTAAMTAQKETRTKLGVLAINNGFMTAAEVEQVHEAQTRVDKRFGEIAVELGFLNEDQVATLLSSQQSQHLSLGQALIDQGFMDYRSFSLALEQYKQEYSLSDEQFEEILSGSIDALLAAVLSKSGTTDDPAISAYISLFAKNMIRFIDSDIRLELGAAPDPAAYEWVAQQPLLNEDCSISRMTALAGSEASFLQLASVFAQETVDSPGPMMEASVGEWLNLHNGIYLVNLSNEGSELEMAPQTVFPSSRDVFAEPAYTVVRIIGPAFQFDLLLTELSDLL